MNNRARWAERRNRVLTERIARISNKPVEADYRLLRLRAAVSNLDELRAHAVDLARAQWPEGVLVDGPGVGESRRVRVLEVVQGGAT